MIIEVEKICEEKKINLLISQIMNDDFAKMLEKNGYYIIRDGIVDVNAIKIFQTVEKTSTNPSDFIQYKKPNSTKKSDGKSKRKSKRKKSKRKSIRKYKRKFIRKSIKKSKRKSKNFA